MNILQKKLDSTIAFVQIISALLIVNYHTSSLEIPILNHITKLGFIFNSVFVFLSGYLLAKSLSAIPKPTYRKFLYKRINRIYPSFHVALFVIALIYLYTGHKFTSNSLLLAATGFSYYFGDNTFGVHLWFVSVILVCYMVCIPTYHGLKRHPVVFFTFLLSITLVTVFANEKSFYGIYNKVSIEIIYRFLYHYIIFSLALYIGITKTQIFSQCLKWKRLGLFGVLFFMYLWLQPKPYFGLIVIGVAILLTICIIQIISMISPFVEKHLSYVFLLSSVTYELYLIHYSVIAVISGNYHGRYVAYPLVFLISILLAFGIFMLSKPYERLIRALYRWLIHWYAYNIIKRLEGQGSVVAEAGNGVD
jgi:peptidoglycan/LPS O-acetylase OafA/YrhL